MITCEINPEIKPNQSRLITARTTICGFRWVYVERNKENEFCYIVKAALFLNCEQCTKIINLHVDVINVQMSDNHTIIYIGKWEQPN